MTVVNSSEAADVAVFTPAASTKKAIARRSVHFAPGDWLEQAAPRVIEASVDFDFDLNASDDPDAGFVYVEPALVAAIDGSEAFPPGR